MNMRSYINASIEGAGLAGLSKSVVNEIQLLVSPELIIPVESTTRKIRLLKIYNMR